MLTTVRAVPTPTTLQLDWLIGPHGPLLDTPGRVALSSCPGRSDLGSPLRDDLDHLVSQGIRVVVSLVADREMEFYGAYGLRTAVSEAGLRSIHLPLIDTQPPDDLFSARTVCTQILGWLGEGENVLIHCIGGWGRSGTLAAALLTHQGYDAATVMRLVRTARSPRCVESRSQEKFVVAYYETQRGYQRYYLLARRTDLPTLLIGSPGARRLRPQTATPQRRLTLAKLTDIVNTPEFRPPAVAADTVVLSGELPRAEIRNESEEPSGFACPVDRVFTLPGLKPIGFAELLK